MLMRLAQEVAAAERAESAGIEHLRKVLFSHRVALMLDLASAIDKAAAPEQDRLKAELAKAEQSFRISLRPPQL